MDSNLPAQESPQGVSPKLLYALVIVIVAVGGYYYYNSMGKSTKNAGYAPENTVASAPTNPIFNSVSAQLNGKVTKIDGTTLYITNPNGVEGVFKLSSSATLSSDLNGTPLTAQTAAQKIPLNTNIVFFLQWKDNEFQITSVKDAPAVAPEGRTQVTPTGVIPTSDVKKQN